MENKNTNESFEYTYSAPQQAEIKRIRQKYLPREENKMEQLRRLDRSASNKGTAASLIVGIVSTLILGGGMSCALVFADTLFIAGLILGVIGIAGMAAAYPLYIHVTKKEREKIAPEIIRLTDELLK